MGRVSFSRLGDMGRLGNQLFEVAAVLGIAMEHGMGVALPKGWKYRKYFNVPDRCFENMERYRVDAVVTEGSFRWMPVSLDRGRNIDLNGYWQCEKYWFEHYGAVRQMLGFKADWLWGLVKDYFPIDYSGKRGDYCAIHVRRGDYVGNDNYINLSMDYYRRAMETLRQTQGDNLKFIIFSDDEEFCRDWFAPEDGFIYLKKGRTDIDDMALMGGLCGHFILSNSTFAWWAAYLGEEPGKSVVVIPDEFFGAGMIATHSSCDLPLGHWVALPADINNEMLKRVQHDGRIDLRDVTFTIPVKLDSDDRRENLELCIKFLNHHFDTNIIVMEEDVVPHFEYLKEYGVNYILLKAKDGVLHRTKMLNDMAAIAETPIIANWDCDVFGRPEQVLEAVKMLRGGVDMVYPYDGRFVRVPRMYIMDIENEMSLDVLRYNTASNYEMDTESFGGAVLWRKDSYAKAGGENENFVSYGPEDIERYERVKKLGMDVRRVRGVLFHINHWIGENSSSLNQLFGKNNKELRRVKEMDKTTLQNYVAGWAWRGKLGTQKKFIINTPEVVSLLQTGFGVGHFYLLNLARRTDRLAWARRQIAEMGIEKVEIWDAVDGDRVTIKGGGDMSPGMLGCYESHRQIWRDAIANGYENIMVMEDDLMPVENLNWYLEHCLPVSPEDWDFIWLGYGTHGGLAEVSKKLNKYWVVPKSPWGTHAYLVRNAKVLQHLLDRTGFADKQIDNMLTHDVLWRNELKMYAVYPSLVGQNHAGLGTDVQRVFDVPRVVVKDEKI